MTSAQDVVVALDLLTQPVPEGLAHPGAQVALARLREMIASDNVVGVGVARKTRQNQDLGRLGLTFYVKQKKHSSRLRRDELIPRWLPSSLSPEVAVGTDVVELGEVTPQAAARVIGPGRSVSHILSDPGTLGAIVDLGGSRGLLSNCHVLARSGRANLGDGILYPAKQDGGLIPGSVVATLAKFEPFISNGEFVNTVDCAVATVISGFVHELSPAILGVGSPTGTTLPARGMEVVKLGRTSGLTKAIVKDVNFRFVMTYPGVGPVGFRDQILCTPYSSGGDSGALVLEASTKRAVGLHFAGSVNGSIFSPIRAVLDALQVRLVA